MYTILLTDPWDNHLLCVYGTHMTSAEVDWAVEHGTYYGLPIDDCYHVFSDHDAIDYLTPLV